ncbi:hypothetical protein B0H11DRAFT_1909331 [Mycena galericulata]|nr:hypothetical protein B0H11DRAFT_1909331 [Mycena galericulata]
MDWDEHNSTPSTSGSSAGYFTGFANRIQSSQKLEDVARRRSSGQTTKEVAVGGITVGPAILVGTLNLLGFSSAGVVGGSIAAGIQSAVYGTAVGSGSLFAMAQSAAAGGVSVAPVANQALSAAAMALGAWVGFGRGEDDTPPAAPATQVSLEDEQSN